jgi:poly-gamma-glutamate capsule biosynthesis protein CapA/YwtB (metallophosphatase superfamily)
MSKTAEVIRFQAQVAKVQTLADGGIRLVLDLPETAIDTAAKMMQAKQAGAALEIAAVPVKVVKSKKTKGDSEFEVSELEL